MTTPDELDRIALRAERAAAASAVAEDGERAHWLEAVAEELDAHAEELVSIGREETHLPEARLGGEVARTTGQLRMFAQVVREGSYREAILDNADPLATPPKPDLRRMLRPLGPVAVFSASNFPFAFSVAGGDTASALAVGCPVVLKAHPGHERLSWRTAELVERALLRAGAPDGVFAMVTGREAGIRLVQHPAITAVGFTGSMTGGRALFALAAGRPDPIPFYGELGSLNPVVITPGAMAARGPGLAQELAASFTLGAGQFCTKPGVVFIPAGGDFPERVATSSAGVEAVPMLLERIAESFSAGLRTLAAQEEVRVVGGPIDQDAAASGAAPVVLATDSMTLRRFADELLVECFGPVTLLVSYRDHAELLSALKLMPGSLTATLHAQPGEEVIDLVDLLTGIAGRVLFAGWPTGVAVGWAQHHGGPWPSTTSIFTSVGATAVRRFQRPVVYQDAPEELLPPALRDGNPLGIPRREDGVLLIP